MKEEQTVSYEDVKARVLRIAKEYGRETAVQALDVFDVKKATELPCWLWPEFVRLMDKTFGFDFADKTDPNAAMIARDGPKKPPYCVCGNLPAMGIVHRTDGPCYVFENPSTAHPPIAGLCLSPDTAEGYRLGGRFGTVR